MVQVLGYGAGAGLWYWVMMLSYGAWLWCWVMVLGYGAGLWFWVMVPVYGTGSWRQVMVLGHGAGLWCQVMVLGFIRDTCLCIIFLFCFISHKKQGQDEVPSAKMLPEGWDEREENTLSPK